MLIDFVPYFKCPQITQAIVKQGKATATLRVRRSHRPLSNKEKQQQHLEKIKAADDYEKYKEKNAVAVRNVTEKTAREFAVLSSTTSACVKGEKQTHTCKQTLR